MRKIILFLVFSILPLCFYGQTAYIFKDSTLVYQDKITDNGEDLNSQYCTVDTGKEEIHYTPDQISEYGLNDGRVYVAKSIYMDYAWKKVFLLRLAKGKLSLYSYKGKSTVTFFWEKDSIHIYELPKYHKDNPEMNFRNDLEYLTSDCEIVQKSIYRVRYNSTSLTELINNYNECKQKPFVFFRYGILLGFGLNKLENSAFHTTIASSVNFRYESNILPGLFADYPIHMSDFSIHADLYFTKSGYSYKNNFAVDEFTQKNIDFVANTTTINIPVLIRYTLPFMEIKPFLNAGLVYAYNFKNSTVIYNSTIFPTYKESSGLEGTSMISKNQVGLSAGGGMEFKLNEKHAVFIELRYNQLNCIPNQYSLSKSEFQLITGLNL